MGDTAVSVYDTGSIYDMVIHCDDIERFKSDILAVLRTQREMWKSQIGRILGDTGLSIRKFAELCQVSETAVRKWRAGALPQSRDMYIRIGFAAGYNLEEMNSFLQRYGRCAKLYVRSLEDSVCIFVLRSETMPHTYQTYTGLLEYAKMGMSGNKSRQEQEYSTEQLSERLAELSTEEELSDFVRSNVLPCRRAYGKLCNYILAYLQFNLTDAQGDCTGSFHAMASESRWSSSLRHCICEIRAGQWLPLRHKVISLGLHLNMDVEGINTMLRLAQMESLCARNPVEAAVIFAVEDAKLNDLIFCNGSGDLCQYVKNIFRQIELSDSEYLIDDL